MIQDSVSACIIMEQTIVRLLMVQKFINLKQGGHYLEKPGEILKNLEFQIGTLKTLKKDEILEKP